MPVPVPVPVSGPPQPGFHPYPPMMRHSCPRGSGLTPRRSTYIVINNIYTQLAKSSDRQTQSLHLPLHTIWVGIPPAFQGMGLPPAAALLQHPSAPPLAQPSHDTHLEQGPEEQAPVADAEESAVKRGKRKAVDLDDDDAPPRRKQTIHPLVDYPDFELVQYNGGVRYKCCLSQCENIFVVPRAGIEDHIRWKRHPQVRSRSPSLEYYEAINDGDFSNELAKKIPI
ncbi:hypothetical protein BDR06DRAFT_69591 [Suillus hirtellus]|nr:hypothetical protein BDR06DRAFT_69591 [Suillus hirtellus]